MFVLNRLTWILLAISVQLVLCENNLDSSDENAELDEYELIFAHVVSVINSDKYYLKWIFYVFQLFITVSS